MKMPVILLLMLVICCLCGFSCSKDFMPPITTKGEGTMGFYIDGKKWVAYSDDFKLPRTGAKYFTSVGMSIYGVTPNSLFEMKLKNPKAGTYQFTIDDVVKYKPLNSPYPFSLNIIEPANSLIITRYDSIISGTFSFKLKSDNGAIVSITSGRFDITISH